MKPKIRYKSGYKYQLMDNYSVQTGITGYNVETNYYQLSDNGILLIKASFAWDGPTDPAFDTKNFMRGSLVHDVFYGAIANGLLPMSLKKPADELLRAICREDGMSRIRAFWVYRGVRLNRRPNANPIMTAP